MTDSQERGWRKNYCHRTFRTADASSGRESSKSQLMMARSPSYRQVARHRLCRKRWRLPIPASSEPLRALPEPRPSLIRSSLKRPPARSGLARRPRKLSWKLQATGRVKTGRCDYLAINRPSDLRAGQLLATIVDYPSGSNGPGNLEFHKGMARILESVVSGDALTQRVVRHRNAYPTGNHTSRAARLHIRETDSRVRRRSQRRVVRIQAEMAVRSRRSVCLYLDTAQQYGWSSTAKQHRYGTTNPRFKLHVDGGAGTGVSAPAPATSAGVYGRSDSGTGVSGTSTATGVSGTSVPAMLIGSSSSGMAVWTSTAECVLLQRSGYAGNFDAVKALGS